MMPVNEDPQALHEQRERVIEDLKQRAIPALDEESFRNRTDDAASILAAWAMQDGVTLDAIRSEAMTEISTRAMLWLLIRRVTFANRAALRRLSLSSADRLMALNAYGSAAVEAAQAEIIESFRQAAQAQYPALPETEMKFLVLTMAAMMLARLSVLQKEETARLRAEIIAAGSTLPEDRSPDA
jgi:hypothetical protein